MKYTIASALAALAVQRASGHAIFQQLWVNGVDMQGYCANTPDSNSPVTNVASNDIRCNVVSASNKAKGKCPVPAGSTVTVEMHQQKGDRPCGKDSAIGGQHYGPVMVYMSKVADASTADGSTGWFKIFEDGWAAAPGSSNGDGDYWGTNDMNNCCGRLNIPIPASIPSGDYLLRAEAIALHTAASAGNAQFYLTCYQITVSGGGSASPATVSFPGAYKATDPGILVDIHSKVTQYVIPGPALMSGGTEKTPGSTCAATGGEHSTGTGPAFTGGPAPTSPATAAPPPPVVTTAATTAAASSVRTTMATTPSKTTTTAVAATSAPATGGCTVAKYGQCGGTGFTGCKTCVSGSTCKANGDYYSQCV